jgi:hypothetical protein
VLKPTGKALMLSRELPDEVIKGALKSGDAVLTTQHLLIPNHLLFRLSRMDEVAVTQDPLLF